jgi:hypothetical protein
VQGFKYVLSLTGATIYDTGAAAPVGVPILQAVLTLFIGQAPNATELSINVLAVKTIAVDKNLFILFSPFLCFSYSREE